MIRFSEDHSLKLHNTFGIEAKASYYFSFTEPQDLEVFLNDNQSWKQEKIQILGEGSNLLFLDNFDGLVIHPMVPGITTVYEDRQYEWLEVGAGEVWDELVQHAVGYKLGGIENLSLIPGMVGAAPVQNIGAYGQEVCNVIEKVKGFNLETKQAEEYSAEQCKFAYRDSIFKNELKNKFIVTSVIFRLEKFPEFNLKYGHLEEAVKEKGEVNLRNIRAAVCDIRNAKLPDVKKLGNAGSFFKNPVVEASVAETLLTKFAEMPVYDAGEGKKKLAAGWLIDQCGWKGKQQGNVAVHKDQALVIVNCGGTSGKEIYDFSEQIKASVAERFGVTLEREVNVIM